MNGPISVSLVSETQAIQLAQLCPPEALRPHFQEAILLGSYPVADKAAIEGEGNFFAPSARHNFACRLLAKFHLKNYSNWKTEGFQPYPREILYPNGHDRIYRLVEAL